MKTIIINNYKEVFMPTWRQLIAFVTFYIVATHSVYAAAPSVDLIYPQANEITQQLDLSGTIKPQQNAQLAPLEQGVVARIFVESGDRVTTGQKLITLDSTIALAKLQQAKAELISAQVRFDEASRLYQEVIALSKQQVVAKTLIAQRKSQKAIASAEKVKAQATLAEQQEIFDRHTLTAPFSGVISQRNIDLGEWVSSQSHVFSLMSEDKLRLELAIPQEYFHYFKASGPVNVQVTPDIQHSQSIEANVSRVVAATNEHSRTFKVFVDLSSSHNIMPGISAHARVSFDSSNEQKVWLPKSAIKHHPDGGYSVFSVENNIAKRHIVKVVDTNSEQTAITNMPPNRAFVISGVELLQDGETVSVASVKGSKK